MTKSIPQHFPFDFEELLNSICKVYLTSFLFKQPEYQADLPEREICKHITIKRSIKVSLLYPV